MKYKYLVGKADAISITTSSKEEFVLYEQIIVKGRKRLRPFTILKPQEFRIYEARPFRIWEKAVFYAQFPFEIEEINYKEKHE